MFRLFKRRRPEVSTLPTPLDQNAGSKEVRGVDELPDEERRLHAHSQIPDAEDLLVHVQRDGQPPVEVDLLDMSIQGAGVRMPSHSAPEPLSEELVELAVGHPTDGWRVTTMAHVRRVRPYDRQSVLVGLRFVNLGDLYAQLDDALGRYFNRRTSCRVVPDLDEKVHVKLSYEHHRIRGAAHDLSTTGIGIVLPLVQAAIFKTGETVTTRFELPDEKHPIELPAFVRHGYRRGSDVVLGIEFDTRSGEFQKRRRAILAYVRKREHAMRAWQSQFARGA